MTDEERKNMLQRLRASAPITKYDAIKAADEIEGLAADNGWLREQLSGDNLRLRSEIERLAVENDELRTPAIHDVQTLRDQIRLLWNAVIQLQNQVRQPENDSP
jgi:hypothetical protein